LLLCLLYAGANKNVVLKGGDLSEVAANAELSTSSSMRVPALRLGLGEIGAITRIRRCIGESSKGLGCRELPLIASMRYDWDWAVTCQAPYWNEVESRRSAPTGVESLPAQSGHWYASQGMAVLSPICEFVFCVACARSTKNAAGAENPVPPCSDRTGHSRTPQQGTAVEFRVRTMPPFASAATEIFLGEGQLLERSRRLRLALAA
jgi:hypothetical protein